MVVGVIDTHPSSPSYNTVTPLVDLYAIGVTPNHLAISPDGKHAYITTEFFEYQYNPVTQQLVPHYKALVIDSDPATYNTITATVDVGQGPSYGVAFSPDGKRTYLTNAATIECTRDQFRINAIGPSGMRRAQATESASAPTPCGRGGRRMNRVHKSRQLSKHIGYYSAGDRARCWEP